MAQPNTQEVKNAEVNGNEQNEALYAGRGEEVAESFAQESPDGLD